MAHGDAPLNPGSLWFLCLLLFVDGATIAVASTVLLLQYGRLHDPLKLAIFGGIASASGSAVQLLLLRFILNTRRPWLQRFAPSREKLEAAVRSYRSASFVTILVARATPLPDAPLKFVAAVAHYPVLLYGLACLLGTMPYFYALALVGKKFPIPTWVLVTAVVLVALAVLFDRWRKRRKSAT